MSSNLTTALSIGATVASGGTAAPFMAALTAAQTGLSIVSQIQASKAAKAESKYRVQQLNAKQAAERKAMETNAGRMIDERQRAMAAVRAQQAASGFQTGTGTQLAVFGEIGSRYDEQIDEATNRSLDQIASYRESARMERFTQKQENKAALIGMGTTLLSGVATGANRMNQADKTFGQNNAFSFF